MAWDIVGISTEVTANSGNLTVTEPAGVQEGDLLYTAIGYRGASVFTMATGWRESGDDYGYTDNYGAGALFACGFLARIIRGSSAPDLTFTRSGGGEALGACVAYRCVGEPTWEIGVSNSFTSSAGSSLPMGLPGGGSEYTAVTDCLCVFGMWLPTFLAYDDVAPSYTPGSITSSAGGSISTDPPSSSVVRRRLDASYMDSNSVTLCIADCILPAGTYSSSSTISGAGSTRRGAYWDILAEPAAAGGGRLAFPAVPFFGPERRRHGGFAPKRKGIIGWRPPQLLGANGRPLRKAA